MADEIPSCCGCTKAPPERGFRFALLEHVPKAERGLPVDLVVGGFPGVPYPPHAFLPVAGDEDLLRLPLPLARGPRFEGAFGAGRAYAELHVQCVLIGALLCQTLRAGRMPHPPRLDPWQRSR